MDAPEVSWVRSGERWAPEGHPGRDGARWVRVGDPAEIVAVGERLGLPADVIERAGTRSLPGGRIRPHMEHLKGGGVHLTAPTLTFREASADVLTGEVTCLVMDGVVITAETGSAGVLDRVAERLTEPQAALDQLTGGVQIGRAHV